MLHHVSIEVPPGETERALEFWELVGFQRVDAPEPIAEYVVWVERQGTQIHLIRSEEPNVPVLGHPAVVAPDFQATLDGLAAAGFEIEEHGELWGERRAFATMPGGQKVELMAAPPPQRIP
jgi:catechol 2,3-dioxygenase-like lactoylglutathione lyase family enzyme